MANFLEELYYGNVDPQARGYRSLTAGLTEQQKETFEKFKDCQSELSGITEREAFSSGFILATRIMVEVMEGLVTVEEI